MLVLQLLFGGSSLASAVGALVSVLAPGTAAGASVNDVPVASVVDTANSFVDDDVFLID